MLEEPRELLARALLPLMPLPAPPKALLLVELGVLRTCWLPARSGPVPRLAFTLPAFAPPRFCASRVPALGPVPARFEASRPPAGCCRATFCRAFACRLAAESPRVVPPNLLAVPLSPYGAPPRCCGLCCQLLFPRLPLFRLPPLTLFRLPLLTKLLLWLT